MAKVEFDIPEDLEFVRKMSHVDWSLAVAKFFQERLEHIAKLKKIVSKSKLTEKDVEELTKKINTPLSKRYIRR